MFLLFFGALYGKMGSLKIRESRYIQWKPEYSGFFVTQSYLTDAHFIISL